MNNGTTPEDWSAIVRQIDRNTRKIDRVDERIDRLEDKVGGILPAAILFVKGLFRRDRTIGRRQ